MIIGGIEVEPSWQAKPEHPIREMLAALCGGEEPPEYVQGYDYSNLTDIQHGELQDWAATHCVPAWGTGIGVIEAAEKLVEEAVSNGNIPPVDSKWRL